MLRFSSAGGKLVTSLLVTQVVPGSILWPQFLQMNFTYMQESWPDKVAKSIDEFCHEYGDTLSKRCAVPGRGLFIYNLDSKPVGFTNVYLEGSKLNIAEFYVDPLYRGGGIGKKMLTHVVRWGAEQGADTLSLEVDKDLSSANAFWIRFDFELDSSGLRNIYSSNIANNPKLKLGT